MKNKLKIKGFAIIDKRFRDVIMFGMDGCWLVFRHDQKALAEHKLKEESLLYHEVVPIEITLT